MDVGVPSSGVVDDYKAVHLMVVAVVAPAIEGVSMASMMMSMMVSVMVP